MAGGVSNGRTARPYVAHRWHRGAHRFCGRPLGCGLPPTTRDQTVASITTVIERLLVAGMLIMPVSGRAEPPPADEGSVARALAAYRDAQPWAADRQMPRLDPRSLPTNCGSGFEVRAVTAPFVVEVGCSKEGWRRRFRYPPAAPKRAGADVEMKRLQPSAPPPAARKVAALRARAPIERGQAPAAQDVEVVEVAADAYRYAVPSRDHLAGRVAAISIPRGAILVASMLDPMPVIRHGQSVLLSVRGAGFEISAEAVALEDAAVGKLFRLQSATTGETLKARATGPGQGIVELY